MLCNLTNNYSYFFTCCISFSVFLVMPFNMYFKACAVCTQLNVTIFERNTCMTRLCLGGTALPSSKSQNNNVNFHNQHSES